MAWAGGACGGGAAVWAVGGVAIEFSDNGIWQHFSHSNEFKFDTHVWEPVLVTCVDSFARTENLNLNLNLKLKFNGFGGNIEKVLAGRRPAADTYDTYLLTMTAT